MEDGVFDKDKIAESLSAAISIDKSEALRFVEEEYPKVVKSIKKEKYTQKALVPALVGASVGALLTGGLWAAIAIITNYQIGYAAIGIGWLTGFLAVFAAKGAKGLPIQIIAIVMSVFAILVGKYFIVADYVVENLAPEGTSMLSGYIMNIFIENISDLVEMYDILWVALAVYAAWMATQPTLVELPENIE